MEADFSGLRETARNIDHYRRDGGFKSEIVALDPADGREIVTARFYRPGTVAYCCVWIRATRYGVGDGRGYGKAGGYGYHKESAALAEALSDAGVKVSEETEGRGEDAMLAAVEAVALAVSGLPRVIVHKAHP